MNQHLTSQPPAPPASPVQLAQSGQDNELVDLEARASRFFNPAKKVVGVLLTLQGVYGLYQSLNFVFVTVPGLDQAMSAGLVERDAIIGIVAHGLIEVIAATLSLFFAMRLTIISKESAEKIDTALGIMIFFGNFLIVDFVRQIQADFILADLTTNAWVYLLHLPERFLSLLPF